MAASTVLVAGAGAAGAAVLRPSPSAPGHAAPAAGSAGGAGSGQILTSEQRQQAAAVPAAPQTRLRVLAAQQAISARKAAVAARKAAAARAARLAAQQQAAREAARQQAAQQATQPVQSSPAPSAPAPAPAGSAQQVAKAMLGSFGWPSSQFSCLDPLWEHESGWSTTASNPSGAYGIPQALPGSKMASAGADWETSATTQIRWGLGYIKGTYGSPCSAWAHEEAVGWY